MSCYWMHLTLNSSKPKMGCEGTIKLHIRSLTFLTTIFLLHATSPSNCTYGSWGVPYDQQVCRGEKCLSLVKERPEHYVTVASVPLLHNDSIQGWFWEWAVRRESPCEQYLEWYISLFTLPENRWPEVSIYMVISSRSNRLAEWSGPGRSIFGQLVTR